jgi:hypothetical protein
MDRLDVGTLAPQIDVPAMRERIEVLEQRIAGGLLRGIRSAAEYRTISGIVALQHAEALVWATPPKRP